MEDIIEFVSFQPVKYQIITYADGRIKEQDLHIIYRIKNEKTS